MLSLRDIEDFMAIEAALRDGEALEMPAEPRRDSALLLSAVAAARAMLRDNNNDNVAGTGQGRADGTVIHHSFRIRRF
jgi:hypothetical protein